MEAKEHSPGPWIWRPTVGAEKSDLYLQKYRLCGNPQNLRVLMADSVGLYDAQLIRAAPECLKALKKLLAAYCAEMGDEFYCECKVREGHYIKCVVCEASNAIEEASGRSWTPITTDK